MLVLDKLVYTVAALRCAVKADVSLKWVQLNKHLSQHGERLCQTTIRQLTHTHTYPGPWELVIHIVTVLM